MPRSFDYNSKISSRYSADRKKLCGHSSWRVGCVSCIHHETVRLCAEVSVGSHGNEYQTDQIQTESRLKKVAELVEALESRISQEYSEDVRRRLRKKQQEPLAHRRALLRHSDSLEDVLVLEARRVDEICHSESNVMAHLNCTDIAVEYPPCNPAAAFEEEAAREESRRQKLWRENASTPVKREYPKFKKADPERQSSFKGLDRTKIPANPDQLVDSALGLEIFLRSVKHRKPPHPMSAIGLTPGPAIMSYGRAVIMFGEPEPPGKDWPSGDQMDSEISGPGKTRERRMKNALAQPTLPKLAWALFRDDTFLDHTEKLVAQYTKLVKDKESDDRYMSDEECPTTGEWPEVRGLDWSGLVRWIVACVQADDKFLEETLPAWDRARDRRSAMVEQLKQWNLVGPCRRI